MNLHWCIFSYSHCSHKFIVGAVSSKVSNKKIQSDFDLKVLFYLELPSSLRVWHYLCFIMSLCFPSIIVTEKDSTEIPPSCILSEVTSGLARIWFPCWRIPCKIMKFCSRIPRSICPSKAFELLLNCLLVQNHIKLCLS